MKKRKALTLLEVVISMALVGVIAVVFLTIFSTGNKNIFRSGKRTETILKIQSDIDEKINNLDDPGDKPIRVTISSKNLEETIEQTIKGKMITEELENPEFKDLKIITFVPNMPVVEQYEN